MNAKQAKLATRERVKRMAILLAVASLMGRGYAEKEMKSRTEARRHGYRPTHGAFGGPKRSGAKLIKRMVKAGLKARVKAHRSEGR